MSVKSNDGGGGGYGTRMSVKSNDGGRGGYGTRMSVKSNDGGGGGYGTRMSVKSNDGGGGGSIQRGQQLCYKCHCCLVFFWYCMEVPDPNLGGIVQSVAPSMPGKLNSTCVLVLLFIFKVHFLNTCFSHVQCGVYIPGVHTVGG